jgi:dTDP-4-dehydrorhamnose 3,5-epimerase
MQSIKTPLPGCYEIQPRVLSDARGSFVKTFHRDWFAECGLATEFAEVYYSMSDRRVLRGLHFQLPPHDCAKLVYCVAGQVMDVAVDLRVGSPTFGQFTHLELSAERANLVYLPTGLAHGFYTLSEQAVMVYHVTTVGGDLH